MKTSTLAGHCLLPIGVLLTLAGCTNGRQDAANTVVVFVSEDQVFSEPILRDFEQETGIRVQAVFDTEETKPGSADTPGGYDRKAGIHHR